MVNVTRWESSKRPLYVKTVWKDGQHHVLLGQQQLQQQKQQQQSDRKPSRRAIEADRPVKSAVTSSLANLTVSSVRLLAVGDVLMKRRCKTGVRKRLKIDFKSNDGEISRKNLMESKIVDEKNIGEACLSSVQVKRDKFVDDNLAEKVLVWLDLATQNGRFPACVNMDYQLENQNTLNLCKKRRVFAKKRCFSSYYEYDFDIIGPSLHVEGVSPVLQAVDVLKNARESPVGEEKLDKIRDGSFDCVSSVLEDNYTVENIVLPCRVHQKSSIKRQLHIFLPDIKKKSDRDFSNKCNL